MYLREIYGVDPCSDNPLLLQSFVELSHTTTHVPKCYDVIIHVTSYKVQQGLQVTFLRGKDIKHVRKDIIHFPTKKNVSNSPVNLPSITRTNFTINLTLNVDYKICSIRVYV